MREGVPEGLDAAGRRKFAPPRDPSEEPSVPVVGGLDEDPERDVAEVVPEGQVLAGGPPELPGERVEEKRHLQGALLRGEVRPPGEAPASFRYIFPTQSPISRIASS